MKLYKIVISALALALVCSSAVADVTQAEQLTIGDAKNASDIGVQFEDVSTLNTIPTLLTGGEIAYEEFICNGVNDPHCKTSKVLRYKAFLRPCDSVVTTDCIEEFWAVAPDGTRINGVLDQQIGELKYPYTADKSLYLPEGGYQTIWKLPGVSNSSGTDLYALSFARHGISRRTSVTMKYPKFDIGAFNGGIFPVSVTRANVEPNKVNERSCGLNPCITIDSGNVSGPSQTFVDGRSCAVIGVGVCAIRQGFVGDYKFGVTLKFSQPIKGWMHGRTQNSSVDYQANSKGASLTIIGNPARVPFIGGWAQKSLFGNSLKGLPAEEGRVLHVVPSGEKSMEILSAWLPILNDTSLADPTMWMIRTLDENEYTGSANCLQDMTQFAGLVTTNSTTYSSGPPVFNKKTMSLDYKLASPHFTSKKEVFAGSYVLVIKSDIARCVYGFSKAPIRATISVISSNGENKVATESINEKNGFLTLSAQGFTFSNPTIRVRISQSVTCQKGKSKIEVKGINSQCPTGYKKVA